jgi:two-component system, NtrC family, response regulator GlrR
MHAVVVVDDEPAVRTLTARWLEAGGYAVRSALSAEAGLALIHAEVPAVLVCDVQMPGRDGLWLVNQVRRRFAGVAIVMATGGHDLEAAAATMRLGVSDYILKPFTRARLLDAVAAAVLDSTCGPVDGTGEDISGPPGGPQASCSAKEGV